MAIWMVAERLGVRDEWGNCFDEFEVYDSERRTPPPEGRKYGPFDTEDEAQTEALILYATSDWAECREYQGVEN